MAKARKFAIESFAESLLPVKDSLEAAHRDPGRDDRAGAAKASHATLRQLSRALERNKVVEIDPAAGRAASIRTSTRRSAWCRREPRKPTPSSRVLQKGYLIADRVLRPALVTVAAPK